MTAGTARRGIDVAPFEELSEPSLVAELAAKAERRGWDGFFVWDHVAYREPVKSIADPWVTLAAVAVKTERVTIGPMVTPIPRRRPHQLARETVTLDRLSGGRLVLGVGLGSERTGEFDPTASARRATPRSGLGCSTTGSIACSPTGTVASSRARCSVRAFLSGWPLAGRTGVRCAGPRAMTAFSPLTFRTPTRSRRSRRR